MCGKTRGTRDRWIDTTTLRSVVFGRTVKKNKFFGVDTNAVDRVWYGSAEKGKKKMCRRIHRVRKYFLGML